MSQIRCHCTQYYLRPFKEPLAFREQDILVLRLAKSAGIHLGPCCGVLVRVLETTDVSLCFLSRGLSSCMLSK